MKCPFLSTVTRTAFQNSSYALKDVVRACPFMQSKCNIPTDVIVSSNYLDSRTVCPISSVNSAAFSGCPFANPTVVQKGETDAEAKVSYPHTNDVETDSSVCSIVDHSRKVHSEVLQDIERTTPRLAKDENIKSSSNETVRDIPQQWTEQISGMISKKKQNKTYREFKKINKSAQYAPKAEEVKSNKIFTNSTEVYCSNDYLNMSSHHFVMETSIKAARLHGCGAGGTRNISGTSELTNALETEVGEWHQKNDALLFNGCYVANDATLSTLLGRSFPNAQCFSDSGNHASMIQGMLRGRNEQRNRKDRLFVFQHDNLEHLEELLYIEQKRDPSLFRIVAFESVHSMNGNIQRVAELCKLAHKYGALSFCDEVHAIGLYGETGAGIGELENIQDQIDIVSGTLSKGVGCFGGYIAATNDIVDLVRQHAPGFIFTTALPPTVLAPNIASIRVLKSCEGKWLREQHWEAVDVLRSHLDFHGIVYKKHERPSHVTVVELGSATMADHVMNEMEHRGYYVQAIKHPTVPIGEEMLRITVSPKHLKQDQMIPRFVRNLAQVIQYI